MRAGEASRTAELIAMYRVLDRQMNEPPILDDRWAARMIRAAYRVPAESKLIRGFYIRFINDIRPMMITSSARSRIAEDVLAMKAATGPVQWVLLGAGLDTFAWRHPEHSDIPQFEVDHPSTQRHKRALVEKLGLKAPAKHHFVEIDFEKTKISDALVAAGFDTKVPAVFAWLGVTYYLTRAAIEKSLTEVASVAAPGSSLVCDYRLPDHHIDPIDLALQRKGDQYVEKWGEPHITKLETDDMRALAEQTGWTIASDVGRPELIQQFAQQCRNGARPTSNYRIATLAKM